MDGYTLVHDNSIVETYIDDLVDRVLEAVWQNIKRILQGLILSLRFGSYFLQ
jgi:hypothetical protein